MKYRRLLRAFTLTELLLVVFCIAVVVGLLVPVAAKMQEQAALVKCTSNLKVIGVAAHTYAADHQGYWPYYTHNMTPPQPRNPQDIGGQNSLPTIYAGEWNGLGLLLKGNYLEGHRSLFCPVEKRYRAVMDTFNWETPGKNTWIGSSYAQRGYKQFSHRFMNIEGRNAAKAAEINSSAILSCDFLYKANGNANDFIASHKGIYPVLFGGGSVRQLPLPRELINFEKPPQVWGNTAVQLQFWTYFDQGL